MIRRGLVLMGFAAACFLSACVPGAVWARPAPAGGAEGLAPFGIEPTALG